VTTVRSRISRRSFTRFLIGVVIASPTVAIGQDSEIRRIGVLELGKPWSLEMIHEQAEPLRKLGWVEGQNLVVERRYDNGRPDSLQVLARRVGA
jgi:hypothetical protein